MRSIQMDRCGQNENETDAEQERTTHLTDNRDIDWTQYATVQTKQQKQICTSEKAHSWNGTEMAWTIKSK